MKGTTAPDHRAAAGDYDVALPANLPTSIPEWKAYANGLLTEESCAFHRNVEISARYSWIYLQAPAALKWSAMAAIASRHVRLAMFPLRLDTTPAGHVNLPRSLGRRRVLLTADVNTIRETNNAIFDDIGWVHLAYLADDDGITRLRELLAADAHYAQILRSFELIERGRRVLEDPGSSTRARLTAADEIWSGNVGLLEHEQRVVVQPAFDRLSCAFSRIMSMGTASAFGVRGPGREIRYFTSFYGYSLTRGAPLLLRSRAWPNVMCFDERWRWLTSSVVPRFRRFEAERALVQQSMTRARADAARYASMRCPGPASGANAQVLYRYPNLAFVDQGLQ